MRSERVRDAIIDIIDNINAAQHFTAGMTFETFIADQRTVYAVIRCLEIISEASRRLDPETKLRNPHIPWQSIANVGNVYRHPYHKVELDLVWAAVQERLGEVRHACIAERDAFSAS
ncbi:HepT-like ribonuclease domain-containing protein [Methylobacterium sp. WCS2018Hpa-22]|uniref:HepT-like ribonuclease domain-containing protein n=1 Tax=unclassified Methylobacterium TaxID=2615210 RepID=UPI0028896954|nr:HepT-like ribonuclease domain-containing protein [Methylobacterium sp. WCS2018Hpa-22]